MTIKIDVSALNGVRNATRHPGWTTEQTTTFHGHAAIQLKDGPGKRGQKRATYLIMAPTITDCYRALVECLEQL